MKQKTFQKFNINGLDSFKELIPTMADAEKLPIHVRGTTSINPFAEYNELVNNEEFWCDSKVAVVNSNTREVANVVSPNYRILQHQHYFSMIAEMLETMGLRDVRGYVLETDGGTAYAARMIVDSLEITEPNKGQNVKIGFEFLNSHDATSAVRGAGYFLRISCTNQMLLKNRIPGCDFSRTHVARDEEALLEEVTSRAVGFTGQLVKSGARFEKVIEEAMAQEHVFADLDHLQATLEHTFRAKKHAEELAGRAKRLAFRRGDKILLNSWDLYNAVTEYTSHAPMTPQVFERLLYKAENEFLTGKFDVPEYKTEMKAIA